MSPPKPKLTVEIQNVVATARLEQNVNLEEVHRKFPRESTYRPEVFPGVVFHLKRPKTSVLIFSTGRMVCTGAKSEAEAKTAIEKVSRELKRAGILAFAKPKTEIQNIVASGDLGKRVNLELACMRLSRAIYEPDQFPGLIHRMDSPQVAVLIFATGKIVCAGARNEAQLGEAVAKLKSKLKEERIFLE